MAEYDIGEDIRDDLVNAVQCLANVKFYIRVELPYCSQTEVAVLEKALTYLFIDLRSQQRREHAELCYAAIHKRAVALFAWIDKTIEFVIEPELSNLSRIINEKANKLKFIRKEEIRIKYPGSDIVDRISNSSSVPFQLSDFDVQSNFSSLDPETDKIFNELEFDQLAPLPSVEEISVNRNDEDLRETFKIELREEFALGERNLTNNISADGIKTHRRNTLSRKLLLIEDSFR